MYRAYNPHNYCEFSSKQRPEDNERRKMKFLSKVMDLISVGILYFLLGIMYLLSPIIGLFGADLPFPEDYDEGETNRTTEMENL